jgi:Ca-activated chloride channel family protein
VIDRSGSMSGDKIVSAKQAAAACVASLERLDRVSVVSFDDFVATHVSGATVAHRRAILDGISRIETGGSTALCDGWMRGAVEARSSFATSGINRVVLITDGQANVGETNPSSICRMVAEAAGSGVTTSTIGIGSDYNEELLIPMAEAGRGNASHVSEPAQLPRIVQRELSGLAEMYGADARLGIEPAEGVEIVGVLNDLPRGRHGRLKIGDLAFGATIDVVLRIRVSGEPEGQRRLFDVRLSWSSVGASAPVRQRVRQSIEATFAPASALVVAPCDPDVLIAGELLRAASARTQAIAQLDYQRIDPAIRTIAKALERLQFQLTDHLDRPEVMVEIRALERLLDELRQRQDLAGTRKRMRYEARYAMLSRRADD